MRQIIKIEQEDIKSGELIGNTFHIQPNNETSISLTLEAMEELISQYYNSVTDKEEIAYYYTDGNTMYIDVYIKPVKTPEFINIELNPCNEIPLGNPQNDRICEIIKNYYTDCLFKDTNDLMKNIFVMEYPPSKLNDIEGGKEFYNKANQYIVLKREIHTPLTLDERLERALDAWCLSFWGYTHVNFVKNYSDNLNFQSWERWNFEEAFKIIKPNDYKVCLDLVSKKYGFKDYLNDVVEKAWRGEMIGNITPQLIIEEAYKLYEQYKTK